MRLRRGRRRDQRAIVGEDGDRFAAAGQQPRDPLVDQEIRTGAVGGGNQDACGAIGERDARAGAGERASDAGAKAEQLFDPFGAVGRKLLGEPRDLRGGRLPKVEAAGRKRRRRRRPEDCSAGRVGPEHAARHPTTTATPACGRSASARRRGSCSHGNGEPLPLIAHRYADAECRRSRASLRIS